MEATAFGKLRDARWYNLFEMYSNYVNPQPGEAVV